MLVSLPALQLHSSSQMVLLGPAAVAANLSGMAASLDRGLGSLFH